jgi:hypothetical protein
MTLSAICIKGSQDCAAWGSLLWNYGFSEVGKPFAAISETSDWASILDLIEVFCSKFFKTSLTQLQKDHMTEYAKRFFNFGKKVNK